MERIKGTVHDIEVVQRGAVKYMRFGPRGGWQGALDVTRPSRPVFPYQRAFRALLSAFPQSSGQFLSFGVGTGTSLRSVQAAFPEMDLFGVELDERVLDVAIGYFDAPKHHIVNYFVGDGLEFLNRTTEKFTLMFVDAYMSNRIYSPCLNPSVPQMVFDTLTPTGVACFNFIMQTPPTGELGVWLNTAKEVFSSIYLLPVGLPYTEQNTLVVASKETLPIGRLRRALRTSPNLTLWEKFSWPIRLASL